MTPIRENIHTLNEWLWERAPKKSRALRDYRSRYTAIEAALIPPRRQLILVAASRFRYFDDQCRGHPPPDFASSFCGTCNVGEVRFGPWLDESFPCHEVLSLVCHRQRRHARQDLRARNVDLTRWVDCDETDCRRLYVENPVKCTFANSRKHCAIWIAEAHTFNEAVMYLRNSQPQQCAFDYLFRRGILRMITSTTNDGGRITVNPPMPAEAKGERFSPLLLLPFTHTCSSTRPLRVCCPRLRRLSLQHSNNCLPVQAP